MNFLKRVLLFMILFLLLATAKAFADHYTLNVSTYDVKGTTIAFAAGGYPNIADGLKIDRISLSNNGDVQQLIQIYENATSTTAATLCWQVVLASASVSVPAREFTFPWTNNLKIRNMAVKKSQAGSNVYMNFQFK